MDVRSRIILSRNGIGFKGKPPSFADCMALFLNAALTIMNQVVDSAPSDERKEELRNSVYDEVNRHFGAILRTFDPTREANPDYNIDAEVLRQDMVLTLNSMLENLGQDTSTGQYLISVTPKTVEALTALRLKYALPGEIPTTKKEEA